MGSRRLPGKVLTTLRDRPVLAWVTEAATSVAGVASVIVATGDTPENDPIEEWCVAHGQPVFRGDSEDVLSRFRAVIEEENPDAVMRITADCPMLDPTVCAQVLELFESRDVDYAHNVWPRSWPDGLDCEVVKASALIIADAEARDQADREHVTSYLRDNPGRFPAAYLPCPYPGLGSQRWTLDTEEDLRFLRRVIATLPSSKYHGYRDVLNALGQSLPR